MSRLSLILIGCIVFGPVSVTAQDGDTPLGDVARAARAAKAGPEKPVIDNDNLSVVMDKAESDRLNGQPVFSIDPSGKTFRMTSPDGSCSLSFDAKAAALISTPHVTSNLPNDELAKLDGAASIHNDTIEVSVRNPTPWELKEIVVGLTILNTQGPMILKSANLLLPSGEMNIRTPDVTMLYHLKASDEPGSEGVFRGILDQEIPPGTNWHWALVGARGVPPAAPSTLAAINNQKDATVQASSTPVPAAQVTVLPAVPQIGPQPISEKR